MPPRNGDRQLPEPYKSAMEHPTPDNLVAGTIYKALGELNEALRAAGDADLHCEIRVSDDFNASSQRYARFVSLDVWKRERIIGVWRNETPDLAGG